MAKGRWNEWLTDDGLLLIEGWKRNGLSDEQIAHNMGIGLSTLKEWRARFPAITAAMKKGKEVVDLEVENALYKSAMGYTVKVKKPIKVKTEKQLQGKGKIVEEHIEYIEEEVHVPASNTAQIFWLKNRVPDRWRDKPVEQTSDVAEKHVELIKAIKEMTADD